MQLERFFEDGERDGMVSFYGLHRKEQFTSGYLARSTRVHHGALLSVQAITLFSRLSIVRPCILMRLQDTQVLQSGWENDHHVWPWEMVKSYYRIGVFCIAFIEGCLPLNTLRAD